ncbi:hypothetical protein [Streptomyces sp. CC228A]|uniref:hypothetical protein n=1 Tax=Streptomyces sp. CC228A TaxID=2898186 RepID=UPI001F1AE64D|nr:hypothetical protein [Streptomyces sp. CC228A]
MPPPSAPYPPRGPYVPGPRGPHPAPYQRPPYGYPAPSLSARFREDDWPTLRELTGRVSGCLWVPLLLCVWPALLLVAGYPLVRSARAQARRVFPADRRTVTDPSVARAQKTRAWAAAAASFVILAAYGSGEDWDQAWQQFTMRLAFTPWLLLLSTPLVVLVLFRLAPPHARPGMRRGVGPAVRSVLWYLGAFTATPLLAWGSVLLGQELPAEPLWIPVRFLLMLPPVWTAMFVAFASGRAVRSAFNTTEVHPTLPALLTGVLVWEFAVINLAVGGLPPGPPPVQLAALLGGPASVTAVAWWEVARLRSRYGVRLRSS